MKYSPMQGNQYMGHSIEKEIVARNNKLTQKMQKTESMANIPLEFNAKIEELKYSCGTLSEQLTDIPAKIKSLRKQAWVLLLVVHLGSLEGQEILGEIHAFHASQVNNPYSSWTTVSYSE